MSCPMNERERMTCENDKKCPLHILSLEDSPMDAELIKEYLLENFGSEIQINVVANEADFISAISKDKFDMILSDFRLPGFNGFQALEHVKSICPYTSFICVSGFIGEETTVELLKQGATDYVSKDKLGRLKYSIERALKESKETEEKEKRSAELVIANKELVFQNEEKEKRAAELIIINKELALQNEEISYISYHDFLTGLYNRIYFEEEKKRLDTPRQLPISIIMGDVNGLKLINDGFGHSKGDEVLIEIAKMGVEAKILSKPGKLSDEEWIEIKKHPEVGFRIAQATSELVLIANYILCHHERWDGKGYPQGLIGEQIPLLSRIVAIVDAFDAMTNDRVYRSARTKGETIEEIRRNSGTQFDPEVTRVFIEKVLGQEWEQLNRAEA